MAKLSWRNGLKEIRNRWPTLQMSIYTNPITRKLHIFSDTSKADLREILRFIKDNINPKADLDIGNWGRYIRMPMPDDFIPRKPTAKELIKKSKKTPLTPEEEKFLISRSHTIGRVFDKYVDTHPSIHQPYLAYLIKHLKKISPESPGTKLWSNTMLWMDFIRLIRIMKVHPKEIEPYLPGIDQALHEYDVNVMQDYVDSLTYQGIDVSIDNPDTADLAIDISADLY